MTRGKAAELEGFSTYVFPNRDDGRTVYWRGPEQQPGVIVLHELPGMVEECVQLAVELSSPDEHSEGLQVHLPLLFGAPGQKGSLLDQARWTWCMRSEMELLSLSRRSSITEWVAALVGDLATRTGQQRVGVIGMCLTGNLVFGLVAESKVGAVVASQPSLPFAISPWHRRALGVPIDEFKESARDGAPLLAMRYRGDWMCPRERFVTLASSYGEDLPEPGTGARQDAQLGNLRVVDVPGRKHALLTIHRDDDSVSTVKDFLHQNLTQTG